MQTLLPLTEVVSYIALQNPSLNLTNVSPLNRISHNDDDFSPGVDTMYVMGGRVLGALQSSVSIAVLPPFVCRHGFRCGITCEMK